MKAGRIISVFCAGIMLMAASADSPYLCRAADTLAATAESAEASEKEADFSFLDLSATEFVFASGVGAWSTGLEIAADGSFSGSYYDMDMGVTGDGYPKGTCYQCAFTGQFTQPEKINEYTWSTQISEIKYEKEPGTQEVVDEMMLCYSEPYGLDGAERILIYLPGAPMAELPEAFRSWTNMALGDNTETGTLPFYGLYNEVQELGFSGYDKMTSDMTAEVASVEEQAAALEQELNENALSQSEMNQKSAELYQIWDDVLNKIWAELKNTLSEEEMSALTQEEIQWISSKEAAVTAAGAEYEGGSLQPLAENMKAALLTKERVYVLLEILNGN